MEDKKFHWKKLTKTVVCGALAILATAFLIISIWVNHTLNKINRIDQQETLSSEQIQVILAETDAPEDKQTEATKSVEPTEITEPVTIPVTEPIIETEPPTEESATESDPVSDVVNILLIGQDRRINETRQRSDAMILCTFNMDTETLTMTSFLRDTYVTLPKYNGVYYGKNRLNLPYLIGGFEMLNDCLEQNFGVEVDHNVEVDFSGFKAVIDALGGVDLELTAGEAQIVEGDLQAGYNHLDGGQALMYARIRKLDDDFERTNRQRNVLMAVIEKTKNLGLGDILRLVDAALPVITTDMEKSDIISYLTKFYPIWKELKVVTQSVPAEGEFYYDMIDGKSVVIPNMNMVRQKIAETIGQ